MQFCAMSEVVFIRPYHSPLFVLCDSLMQACPILPLSTFLHYRSMRFDRHLSNLLTHACQSAWQVPVKLSQ